MVSVPGEPPWEAAAVVGAPKWHPRAFGDTCLLTDMTAEVGLSAPWPASRAVAQLSRASLACRGGAGWQ